MEPENSAYPGTHNPSHKGMRTAQDMSGGPSARQGAVRRPRFDQGAARPKLLAAVALLFALALVSHAEALSATCLTLPLPTVPLSPNFPLQLFNGDDHTAATIWRQPCQDGSGETAVLLRLTAQTPNPHVCSSRAAIVQGGIRRDAMFATSASGSPPFPTFCDDVFGPTTVILLSEFNQLDYDEQAAFMLIYAGLPTTSVEVPAAVVPPAVPTPILTVEALGCTTCQPGNTLGFDIHITNPGAPQLVELKTGARLPDGSVVSILGRHQEVVIGSGVTVIELFDGFVLPAGIPPGTYAIEAALIEPELGVTISRQSRPLTLLP